MHTIRRPMAVEQAILDVNVYPLLVVHKYVLNLGGYTVYSRSRSTFVWAWIVYAGVRMDP